MLSVHHSSRHRQQTYLGGGIDDRNELPQMSRDERVVQDPVLVAQALQERVLRQVALLAFQLVPGTFTLLIEGIYPIWQTAKETKGPTFICRKGGTYPRLQTLLRSSTMDSEAYLC